MQHVTAEVRRLKSVHRSPVPPWRMWGPYVSERSWGTVREDYSSDGEAWTYITHDKSRSKAYRWGEDGIAGICDRYQLLIFALALWNGRDPIIKERMFGLTPLEGNHGEDAKEYWFYLDNTPTHSYMKMLYKYPQRSFPYEELIQQNHSRAGKGSEYELLDTGIFDDDRYFDVFVEYAKNKPEDISIRVEAFNRAPEAADIHIIPHLWFRNTWAWHDPPLPEPVIHIGPRHHDYVCLIADDAATDPIAELPFSYKLGRYLLYGPPEGELLFTDNETNAARVYGPEHFSRKRFVKDAFHRYIVGGEDCINPAHVGTKAAVSYKFNVPPGGSVVLRMRLLTKEQREPLQDVDHVIAQRKKEADDFYESIHPAKASDEEKKIQRQAFAGMLWGKQFYFFDVNRWLNGDNPKYPPPANRRFIRNQHWWHLNSMRILSVPDKWEYPWFAAWDLAFQCVTLALIDSEFAKENLSHLLFEQFQHPNGQLPAYEWEFSDVNPPVHAWACWRVYNIDKEQNAQGDIAFLERCFHKLLINFAWWVNKVDRHGNNVFEGGFLGLDNITVVDRSQPLPGGATLEQSDGTGWMGFFCLHMMRIALELANTNRVYESLATKFFEHFVYIGAAMGKMAGRQGLWDEEDGFFYDVLRYPNDQFLAFRVRSLAGLIPILAVELLKDEDLQANPNFSTSVHWFREHRPELIKACCFRRDNSTAHVLSIVDPMQLKGILGRLWDPAEFLSKAGIRSLSKFHEQNPFRFGGGEVRYEPADSEVHVKGGNSNWRGPIWFPTSYLIIEALQKLSSVMEDNFEIDNSGRFPAPAQMGEEIANRMISLFERNQEGNRPIYGSTRKFQEDPYWRELILFYEFFHAENGGGLGASHQTGWTGLVANLIHDWRR